MAWEDATEFEGGRHGKVFLAYIVTVKRSSGTNASIWCEKTGCMSPNAGEFYAASEWIRGSRCILVLTQAPDYPETSCELPAH